MTVRAKQTRAIIVGIEVYDAGADWNLSGPADDACRFTRWLLDRGVPADNISVLISPVSATLSLVNAIRADGVDVLQASYATIRAAFTTTLFSTRSELLVVYWGGHGAADENESRRLFYSEATDRDKRNLNFSSLLVSMRSTAYRSHQNQLIFVDACTTRTRGRNWIATLPNETFPPGDPQPGCAQNVLFAAQIGQIAVNDNTQRTGLFSQSVMDVLNGSQAAVWPPNPTAISSELKSRFDDLREHGRTDQVPSYLWSLIDSGEGQSLIFSTEAAGPGVSAAAAGMQLLTFAEAKDLQVILEDAVVPDSVARIYFDTASAIAGLPPYPGDPWSAVQALRNVVEATPLFYFLVRLALSVDAAARGCLRTWIDTTWPRWITKDEFANIDTSERTASVTVELASAVLGVGFEATMWAFRGAEGRQVVCADEPWSYGKVGDHLRTVLNQFPNLDASVSMVEFLLSADLLHLEVEQIMVTTAGRLTPLGTVLPVVVRPQGMSYSTTVSRLWRSRWASLQAQPRRPVTELCQIIAPEEAHKVQHNQREDLLCVGIYGAMHRGEAESAAAAVAASGVPAVLWHRATSDAYVERFVVESLLRGRELRALPRFVRQQRLAAGGEGSGPDHPGRNVVLLWNDPNRIIARPRWSAAEVKVVRA